MLKLALQKRNQRKGAVPVYNDSVTDPIEPLPPLKQTRTRKRKVETNNIDAITTKTTKTKDKPTNKQELSVTSIVNQFTNRMQADGGVSNMLINDPNIKLQNIAGTNFPKNTPCYICGPKGSGKTYMLSALLQYVVTNELYSRIFYVYADNVDATIHISIPKDKLYLISKEQAEVFLQKYLKKKTKFCSWSRFWNSVQVLSVDSLTGKTVDELMKTNVYWDNLIDETVKQKKLTSFDEILDYCGDVLDKYSKSTIIKLPNNTASTSTGFKHGTGNDVTVDINVGPFSNDDFDMIVFDDIAQFFDLWGSTRSKSKLYKYFTITRQNRTTFYLCGQDLKMLTKMFREQLGALVCMVGTDIQDLNTYRFSKKMITHIESEMSKLDEHEGFLYNYNTQQLEIIKQHEQKQ